MRTTTKLLLLLITFVLLFIGWFLYDRKTEEQQVKLLLGADINTKNTLFDRIIKIESASLEVFAFDYSHDDALIKFIESSKSGSFPAKPEKLLKSYNLAGIWLLNTEREQVSALTMPGSPDLAGLPLSIQDRKKLLSQRYFQHFFIKTPQGLLEIRCAPLQPQADVDRNGPPHGFLIAGRLWDKSYLETLSSLTDSTITLNDIPPDSSIAEPTYDFDKGIIDFSRVLLDWDNKPVTHMSIRCESPAMREFARTSALQFIQFFLFFTLLQVLLTGALMHWLGIPLRRISKSLEKADPQPLEPLMGRHDELGKFARLIVSSFAQQRALTNEIAERSRAEERLREANQMLKARDQELNASNQQLMAANQQLVANLQQIRKSEQQLLAQDTYLKLALDIAEETVWEINMATGIMKIVKMSEKISRDSGINAEGGISWSQYLSLADAESRERMQRAIDEHLKGKTERFVFEARLQKKTGEWFWLYSQGRVYERDESGSPLTILGNSIDITQIKQAQEELNLLATALEQAWECIVITDRDASILYANPAFERITGYSIAEVLGKNPRMLKSGKHDPEHYGDMWSTLLQGKVWRGHFINRRKDGSLFEEDSTITPLNNGAGEIMNFIAVKRDVTETMNMERQLRQSQKMEAIGTLAGGIAHDFNNILTAINGYTELSLLPGTDPTRLRSNLEQVLRAGARARDLVSQILAFSRQTEQEMRPVAMAPIIKEALRFLRASLPAMIEIRQHIDAESDVVLADPTQLHQVLMNLCTNAGYAMRDNGGVLDVRLSRITYDSTVVFGNSSLKSGTYLRLSISDTGLGMERDVLEHIFEPYFTTKSRGEGTGLGLAVVHGIVQNHGGEITAYSEAGKGAMFEVMLPAIEVPQGVTETKTGSIVGGTEMILIVDDERALVQMALYILEPLGYKVYTAQQPEDALNLFLSHDFDLVITDKIMPRMNGFVFADKIRRIRSTIPIIMCTGYAEKTDADKAREVGISKILCKPYNLQDIASAVREVLDNF